MHDITRSSEYEDALLGAILLDNRVMEEHPIHAQYFEAQRAKEVFRAIVETIAKGAVANIAEVAKALPGQVPYISSLSDASLSSANAGFYVQELRGMFQRREIIKLARQMAEMTHDVQNSSADILGACDRALMDISLSSEKGYRHISEIIPNTIAEIQAAYAHRGALTGIDTGFADLNRRTGGFQAQWFVVIGARPGAGKTAIALNCITAALKAGKCVGMFSAEMSAESITKRLFADWGNVDHRSMITGYVSPTDLERIEEAAGALVDKNLYVNDRPNVPLNDLVSEAYRMKRREKIDILFVDYLSLVSNKTHAPRHEQVAEISQALKGLARELDIPIIALSQLTREAQDERPKLSQLRDSGSVEQDADMVIFLWNRGSKEKNDPKQEVTMITEKHRHGPKGDCEMIFHATRMRFYEVQGA
jgi:replicative DNA helicase